MFIDRLLDTLLRPFRELRAKWWGIKSIEAGIRGDIRRVQQVGYQAKGEAQYAVGAVQKAPGQLQQGYQKVAQGVQPGAPQQPPAGKKMSWFPWSKKTCPACGNKLHKSWDKCPNCGLPVGAPAPQQGMQ